MKKYDSREQTINHIRDVQELINMVVASLRERARNHDSSKLIEPEKSGFDKHIPELSGVEYGSDRYKEILSEMQKTLSHHYSVNRHHPEHYENGINDMDLIDIIEMFCDWAAATRRYKSGDLQKSIDINVKRFGIDEQLTGILINTALNFGFIINNEIVE
jgi:hypothetical protein